jgi:MOSC domain-containing protein YiiM
MIKSYRGVQVNEFGRGVNFGVYADVVAEGLVRVGDPLSVRPVDSRNQPQQ